ncbi:type I restriction endonuclease subunit R [Campylobacter troglodytis]|uniref:type I restriction endonuclease subunit R n=1 Tax=Campylobacter troglodytis TaxID=654363 RepID=UPI0011573A3A|nr:type I restriction endonuclease subunit R [Campylobacter troglodytis]TQR61270.1 DEAD/DEAH box helicase [Campylobacter troglodytis]
MKEQDKNELYPLALEKESTVIAKFVPSEKKAKNYESEAMLEKGFIKQLERQGYEYAAHIKDEKALLENLKVQMQRLNVCEFNENEWKRFLAIIAKPNDTAVDKSILIRENFFYDFEFDDGKSKNIRLYDNENLQNNFLQVVNQYSVSKDEGARYDNRYDVSILVNGLPLVHCEFKKRGALLKNAFYQIKRYGRESFFAGCGLFNFVQIFVISNGTFSKYYSNSVRDRHIKSLNAKFTHPLAPSARQGESVVSRSAKQGALNSANDSFEFTSFWADFENNQIYDLVDFTSTFFARRTLLNVLFKYCVFDTSRNLLVMRPYQIAATEAIINKIKMALHYKHYGTNKANGFIWHSTGSGKTLTSFKTAQLACKIQGIEKVLFVVDRKDLDSQTVSEYNKFEKGCVLQNKSTKILETQLKNPQQKIIVTTIQKLSYFIKGGGRGFCFDNPCVIIFDECHRSQFGEMNSLIKKAFKKHLLFGFTGTPIMDKNKTGFVFVQDNGNLQKVPQTTEGVFSVCLHSYTIANAIKDGNVLPFKVDYNNLVAKFKEAEQEAGLFGYELIHDVPDGKNTQKIEQNKALLNHPERIKEVVSFVLKNFDKKTYRNGNFFTAQNKRILGFNSIFASASIESAKLYYAEFKRQNELLSENERLKIATIFSYGANEEVAEMEGENVEGVKKLEKSSREFLENAIKDYNGIFGTNYDTSSEGFERYYNDISKKMKGKELDMLIVVDMFLTGFDAKELNTLWVDKNLRYHSLLQAYSRTNRIFDSTKQFGNIVCFRDLQEATNESIMLFSKQEDNSEIVLMRSFKEYFEGYFTEKLDEKGEIIKDENGESIKEFHKGYQQITAEIKQKYPSANELANASLEDKKAFIKDINELLKIENILEVFDEFSDDKRLISEQERQDLISAYLEIKEKIKGAKEPNEIIEDIVFEVELLGKADINIEFIYKLLNKAKNESDEKKRENILQEIARWVDSSLKLRDKGDLIKEFSRHFMSLKSVENEDFIDTEFRAFVREKKKEELFDLIDKERLDRQKTLAFIQKAFKNGEMSDLGVEFREILPKNSLFAKQDDSKQIFYALNAFYDKYSDISSWEIE